MMVNTLIGGAIGLVIVLIVGWLVDTDRITERMGLMVLGSVAAACAAALLVGVALGEVQ
jgi:hypothetical protein